MTRNDARLAYRFSIEDPSNVDEIYNRIVAVDSKLDEKARSSWRWRIVYLRAKIDYELVHDDYYVSPACEECFQKLVQIYHAENAYYYVSPPTFSSVTEHRGKEV